MTRLGVLILVLMLTSAALVGGAMLYGRANPQPNQLKALGFDVCDNKPCWRGIVPGATDWYTARVIMLGFGGKDTNFAGTPGVQFASGDNQISVAASQNEHLVALVNLEQPTPFASGRSSAGVLADALELFGTPCGIQKAAGEAGEITLLYSNAVVFATTFHNKVELQTWVLGVGVFDPKLIPNMSSSNLCKSNFASRYIVLPWRGLASIDYYDSLESKQAYQ